MKQILFILTIWAILPLYGYAKKQYNDFDSIPKGFECFKANRQRIFIKYTVPVEGYSVKAMWTVYNEEKVSRQDETIIYFENEEINSAFYIRTEKRIAYNLGEEEKTATLDEEPPCAFLDADFDGKEELLIFYEDGSSEVYNLEGKYPELITEKPFTELNRNSKFDPISKTFTNISYSNGGRDITTFTYQRQDYDYWFTDRVGAYNCYKFELVNVDVQEYNLIGIIKHKIYQRKGSKLELVKHELIIPNDDCLQSVQEHQTGFDNR